MALLASEKTTRMRLLMLMLRLATITMPFVDMCEQNGSQPEPGVSGFVNNIIGNQTILQGYWHNWCNGLGYYHGIAPCVQLKDVPKDYNVISVAFTSISDVGIPTFVVNNSTGMTEGSFLQQVKRLNAQQRIVILALGGAGVNIILTNGQEYDVAKEIIRLVMSYGFNGLDITLEGDAIGAGDNPTVIPAALKMVKYHFTGPGMYFTISASPEFPNLRYGKTYREYFEALEGYYDWISPQFFNQGDDGIHVPSVGWISQDDDTRKKEFIYYISHAIVFGELSYYQIPCDKFVFGIPANKDAAANGYVENPQNLFDAFGELIRDGHPLRGVMTWSINWDMGVDSSMTSYNESFAMTYGRYLFPKHISLPHGATALRE